MKTILLTHFTRINRIIFFLSLLFSAASLVALLKITPVDEDQTRKLLAMLEEEEEYVTRKFANSLAFTEVSKGERLFNGDQIFTGDNSRAKIVFLKSKNVLNIPPRGLVKIEEGESGENVEIQKGLAEFVIQKDQVLNIIKGEEKVVLTSTSSGDNEGKIFFKKDKLIVEVKKGAVELQNKEGKVESVKKDEVVSVSPEEKVITKIISSMTSYPMPDQKVDIWKGIDLSWGHKGPVQATLSKNANFSDVVGKVTLQTSPFRWVLPLGVGKYYLKMKVMEPKAQDEEAIPLDMISPHAISTFIPDNDASVSLRRGEPLRLAWNEVPAEKFRVSVQTSPEEAPVTYESDKPEILLQDIKSDTIIWSVAPVLTSGVLLETSLKKTVNITLEGANKILTPAMGQLFNFGKDKALLSWASEPKEKQHIKIADSKEQVVLEKDVQGNQMEFSPKAPGTYNFTLTSKDYPTLPPASINFSFQSIAAEWVEKGAINLSSIDPEHKKVEMKFTTPVLNVADLEVVVYGDEGLKNKIKAGKVLTKTVNFPLKGFGTYCLVIKGAGTNSTLLQSASRCIYYTQSSPFEKMPAPKNAVLKYMELEGVGGYTFEVPPIPRAVTYEVQIFKDKEAKTLVYTDRSKENTFKWPTKKAGVYFYKYRVLDDKQRQSEYSGIAKLVFPISPLSDW